MIGAKLINWYENNKRDLPWRNTSDPYKIWLSEIILQQTRVAQGLPYYINFVNAFPTVFDLAKAPEQKVLKLWQGLGYYSRAQNLHAAAKEVVSNHKGIFPADYEGLKKLKGVGDYTAAAISSFCYNHPKAVVDGNVYRVLARLFAIDTPINSTEGKKQFAKLAQQLLDKKNAANYNQAIMEFGALYCTPNKPNCEACVFNSTCQTGSLGKALSYPVKIANKKITTRYFNYFIIFCKEEVFIQQRVANDIWKNLNQFPLIETAEKPEDQQVLKLLKKEILQNSTNNFKILKQTSYIKHQLSHQTIFAKFSYINVKSFSHKNYKKVNFKQLKKLPFPILIANEIAGIETSLKT